MKKRSVLSPLFAALFVTLLCVSLAAQTVTQPDQGVRGTGAIMTKAKIVATLDINVARSGDVLFGGFRYTEASTTATRGNVIYSQIITGLTIVGNRATITATGLWNSMPATITIDVLDDLNMDSFHIRAIPTGQILIIYDEAGGLIKGDLVVYSNIPSSDGYVKGEGIIGVGNNIGKFTLSAVKTGSVIKGSAYYYEYNPMSATVVARPVVSIYIPVVKGLEFLGNTATLTGQGYLNGRPAMITVKVKDNSMLLSPVPIPDEYYITAVPLSTDLSTNVGYKAAGPLKSGDVVVKVYKTIP